MSRRTTWLGTACAVAAALAAGPAAADTLTGFAGYANTTYTHTTNDASHSLDWGSASLGGAAALPLADIPNANWQVNVQYQHAWSEEYLHGACNSSVQDCNYSDSGESWDFGFSPFLAYEQSRWGLDLHYKTWTHWGHTTNGGAFFEWYLMDNVTFGAKGGYLSTGGAPWGGHGHYLNGHMTFYGMPNLAITGMVDWQDVVTGQGCGFGHPCLSSDFNSVAYSIDAEFLVNETWPVAIYGGFTYTQNTDIQFSNNDSTFHIGLIYYTGEGSLQDHHRNGNLHWTLTGP